MKYFFFLKKYPELSVCTFNTFSIKSVENLQNLKGALRGADSFKLVPFQIQFLLVVITPVHKKMRLQLFFIIFFPTITAWRPMGRLGEKPKCQRNDVVAGVVLQFEVSY